LNSPESLGNAGKSLISISKDGERQRLKDKPCAGRM